MHINKIRCNVKITFQNYGCMGYLCLHNDTAQQQYVNYPTVLQTVL